MPRVPGHAIFGADRYIEPNGAHARQSGAAQLYRILVGGETEIFRERWASSDRETAFLYRETGFLYRETALFY